MLIKCYLLVPIGRVSEPQSSLRRSGVVREGTNGPGLIYKPSKCPTIIGSTASSVSCMSRIIVSLLGVGQTIPNTERAERLPTYLQNTGTKTTCDSYALQRYDNSEHRFIKHHVEYTITLHNLLSPKSTKLGILTWEFQPWKVRTSKG